MTKSGIPSARFAFDEQPPDPLSALIRADVRNTAAPKAGARRRIAIGVSLAAIMAGAVVTLASQLIYHRYAGGLEVAVTSAPHLLQVLLVLVALTLVATVTAIWRGRSGLGSGAISLYLASALVAPIYAALVLVSPVHTHIDEAALADVAISRWGLRCLVISAIVGLLVLTTFTVALRRSIPTANGLRGAAIGAAAGAWAGLSVFIFCPSGDLLHILIGHILPIVAFSLLGIVSIPRILRI
jgi:hypothetical protein